jgi:RNA polymerase sigma-70 factor (ECF subfamily)
MDQEQLDRLYQRLLVLRCQTGDAAAFEEIVATYSPRLRVYLGQMLAPDAHAADDALQDVWLDCFRQVGRLNDVAAFPAWLYRIARDRAYRLLRRRGVRATSSIEAASDVPVAGDADPSDATDVTELRAAVGKSLDRLPHDQREVLVPAVRRTIELRADRDRRRLRRRHRPLAPALRESARALRGLIERNGSP